MLRGLRKLREKLSKILTHICFNHELTIFLNSEVEEFCLRYRIDMKSPVDVSTFLDQVN